MTRRLSHILFIFPLFFIISWSHAAKWQDKIVDDPIKSGSKCAVQNPVTFGAGGLYDWAMKFDQVAWTHFAGRAVWFCKDSGFAAFANDFSLSSKEKIRIQIFLARNYKARQGKVDIRKIRVFLVAIYALRDKDEHFKNSLLRARALWHDFYNEYPKANNLRKKALVQIKSMLAGKMSTPDRMRYLYVAANYERQFGNSERSDQLIAKLKRLSGSVKPEHRDFYEYLVKQTTDTKLITPGGSLFPKKYKK